MPRRASKVPAYCLHKASRQAVVRLHGKDHYLGPHGSSESHEAYERLITEWRAQGGAMNNPGATTGNPSSPAPDTLINHLLLRYMQHAKAYYVDSDGRPTDEVDQMRWALRPLRRLYGSTPADQFGPRSLKTLRQYLIDEHDLSRKVVNERISRIKRFFNWAVSEELVDPKVAHGLATVRGLTRGRTTARETEPITPVSDDHVAAVFPYVSPQVAAMIQVQRFGAMRPGEVVSMRPCDIDTTGDIWIYRPPRHKSQWRGHERQIYLGPKAQDMLRPFLERLPESPLFSPQETDAYWSRTRRAARKTPLTPSQRARRRKTDRSRELGDAYDANSYRRAIRRGVEKLNRARAKTGMPPIPVWFPLQLRHSQATDVRRAFGLEAAQVILGHRHANVTQIYAERNESTALQVALLTG